jgi:WD40 repeat protein
MAFAWEGRRLVAAGPGGRIEVLDPDSGEVLDGFLGHEGPVLDLAVLPGGERFRTVGRDGQLITWVLGRREPEACREVSPTSLRGARLSGDGGSVAAEYEGGALRVVDVASGEVTSQPREKGRPVRLLGLSPAEDALLSLHADGTLRLRGLPGGVIRFGLRSRGGPGYRSAVFSPRGRILVTGMSNGRIEVWSVATGDHLGRFRGHLGPVEALVFSSDGATIYSGGADTTALAWTVEGMAAGGAALREPPTVG